LIDTNTETGAKLPINILYFIQEPVDNKHQALIVIGGQHPWLVPPAPIQSDMSLIKVSLCGFHGTTTTIPAAE